MPPHRARAGSGAVGIKKAIDANPYAAIQALGGCVEQGTRNWSEATLKIDSSAYGTHSLRRTKAAQIYKKTGDLRAVQILLGHPKLESTVRYLGIEVDDALSIAEQLEL